MRYVTNLHREASIQLASVILPSLTERRTQNPGHRHGTPEASEDDGGDAVMVTMGHISFFSE